MEKIEAYKRLVEKRKSCLICKGLSNPSRVASGTYDKEEIGPWSLWQADLNADFLVVGQDWGDVSYFERYKGRDKPKGNPTNEHLQILLNHIGVQIGKPCESQEQVIFLTNLILCLKDGGLQAPVENDWFSNCTREFFEPLVEIIKPKVILALGKKVSVSILDLYNIGYPKNNKLSELMLTAPYVLTSSTILFPLYHCGAGTVNRNRGLEEQKNDWRKIEKWKEKNFR